MKRLAWINWLFYLFIFFQMPKCIQVKTSPGWRFRVKSEGGDRVQWTSARRQNSSTAARKQNARKSLPKPFKQVSFKTQHTEAENFLPSPHQHHRNTEVFRRNQTPGGWKRSSFMAQSKKRYFPSTRAAYSLSVRAPSTSFTNSCEAYFAS